MLNNRTKLNILLGVAAATLALTVSIPSSDSISFSSTAMANEGGGGGGDSDLFDRLNKKPVVNKKKKRLSAKAKRAERKRKAAERKKARKKKNARKKAARRAKYRRMTGKNLEKGMPSDRNFGSLKGQLRRDIDKARTRKAKAKVAREYADKYKERARQIQGRSVKTANKHRSFAGKLNNYADAQAGK